MTVTMRTRSTLRLLGLIVVLLMPTILAACRGSVAPQKLQAQRPTETNQVRNQGENVKVKASPETGSASSPVKCSIAVEEEKWSKSKPAVIAVVVENISHSKRSLRVVPSFRLVQDEVDLNRPGGSKNEYWSPVDIKKNRALDLQGVVALDLENGESIRFNIDLTTLQWGRSIDAVWPSRDLFAVVPKGRYELYLLIDYTDGKESKSTQSAKVPTVRPARSNGVHVIIE